MRKEATTQKVIFNSHQCYGEDTQILIIPMLVNFTGPLHQLLSIYQIWIK